MPTETSDAAAQQNARLLAVTIHKLKRLEFADRREALTECVPAISEFAASLSGTRRDKFSAWTSLDLALQRRMKFGEARKVSLDLTAQARQMMMSEGRFEHGHRAGFHGADTRLSF